MPHLTWISGTSNRKTGDIPGAYIGQTMAEARASCSGCLLLDGACYAWRGLTRASFEGIVERLAVDPARYTLAAALAARNKGARAVRIGIMGDPSRVDRSELLQAVEACRSEGLAILSYTHFWREPHARGLEGTCLASCENEEDGQAALDSGWTPAVILPWDHAQEVGPTFRLPSGARGVVCPAQTKTTTCNECRLCDVQHPVWAAGKVQAIGFLDHSRAAREERRRSSDGDQMMLFGREARDVRPRRLPVFAVPQNPQPGAEE